MAALPLNVPAGSRERVNSRRLGKHSEGLSGLHSSSCVNTRYSNVTKDRNTEISPA